MARAGNTQLHSKGSKVKYTIEVEETISHMYVLEAESPEQALEAYKALESWQVAQYDIDGASSWAQPHDVYQANDHAIRAADWLIEGARRRREITHPTHLKDMTTAELAEEICYHCEDVTRPLDQYLCPTAAKDNQKLCVGCCAEEAGCCDDSPTPPKTVHPEWFYS